MRFGALFATLVFSTATLAQSRSRTTSLDTSPGAPGHWSVNTGETVSPNRDAMTFAAGWPGVSFSYLHGLTNRADAGFKLEMLYGYEGLSAASSRFGFGLGVPVRLVINRTNNIVLGVNFTPGMRVYTSPGDFLIEIPVGGTVGVQITPEARVALGVDLPMAIKATSGAGPAMFLIGPAFGFGVDYAVDRTLIVGLDARFGPLFSSAGGSGEFAFRTLVTAGYRL